MANYAIKNLNGWNNVEGKIFLGNELGLTGAHEELYVIISGEGEYEVDGEKNQVGEGSIIRVSPAGVRALRNNSEQDMVMMCIQYEAKPISSFMDDANIIDTKQ